MPASIHRNGRANFRKMRSRGLLLYSIKILSLRVNCVDRSHKISLDYVTSVAIGDCGIAVDCLSGVSEHEPMRELARVLVERSLAKRVLRICASIQIRLCRKMKVCGSTASHEE
jgi:hypothetical protein